jgi:hypothetical protein
VLTEAAANVQLHMKVKDVFILTKPWDQSLITQTREVSKWLLENGYNVYVYVSFHLIPLPGALFH